MFITKKTLVLASGSPRRKDYFQNLGFSFSIFFTDIDERVKKGEHPRDFVKRMALMKACSAMEGEPKSWVVAADTIVSMGERIWGKPTNSEDAVSMLMQLSGKKHRVMTGVCIGCREEGIERIRVVDTTVKFFSFSERIARAYVETGESMDKAGAYGIQGNGAMLAEYISGSYTNVVGLPLCEVVNFLCEHEVIAPIGTGGGDESSLC